MIERKIAMTDGLPVQSTEKLKFRLQLGQSLQFHITSTQETSEHIIIEGHDISMLLDYLYDNRELIYDATHDQELRRLEAREELENPTHAGVKRWGVERIFYADDGRGRTVIQSVERVSQQAHE
jgi:hypothetical protein